MSNATNEKHQPTIAEELAAKAVPSTPLRERVPRVAVVGVHGVGPHAAGATEDAMANLLFSLPAVQTTLPGT